MKKIISFFLALIMISLFSIVSLAATLGNLSYWYSSDYKIGRFNYNSVRIYTKKLNSNSDFAFLDAITHARNQWENALDITIYTTINKASAHIIVYGGTEEEIEALGIFSSTNNPGLSRHPRTYEGEWMFSTTSLEGYLCNTGTSYVKDNGYTLNQCKMIATHEIGHVLGWYGHSFNENDVMYTNLTSTTNLTNRDINHLAQIY